jgi:mannose/fructose/N-acetylgalactosamine-specific phosphotransferase system component IIC
MAIETVINTTRSALATGTSSVQGFVLAHPVAVAVVGVALIGAGSYYLVKKYNEKKEQQEPAAA